MCMNKEESTYSYKLDWKFIFHRCVIQSDKSQRNHSNTCTIGSKLKTNSVRKNREEHACALFVTCRLSEMTDL